MRKMKRREGREEGKENKANKKRSRLFGVECKKGRRRKRTLTRTRRTRSQKGGYTLLVGKKMEEKSMSRRKSSPE
jgi:hypothetical protein